jgi:hypothetical protein
MIYQISLYHDSNVSHDQAIRTWTYLFDAETKFSSKTTQDEAPQMRPTSLSVSE